MDSRHGCSVSTNRSNPFLPNPLSLPSFSMARQPVKSAVKASIEKLLADLIAEPKAWAFQHAVDPIDVPDYFDVIKQPMGTRCIHVTCIRSHLHNSKTFSLFNTKFQRINTKLSTLSLMMFNSFSTTVVCITRNTQFTQRTRGSWTNSSRDY